ncbi:MAG: hypothetical protein JW966_15135 [Anaerolineae bacterium]|nr:hypothetical protein [Anaerolineae bacterium]
MRAETVFSPGTLRLSLYSGIGLIVISMLFLGQDVQTASFVIQAGMAIAAPAFFYLVGGLVYRYLQAPLAAPGIVATGAWLIAVELIHLQDQAAVMPGFLRPYYWLVASMGAAVIITLTGYRARIWLLVPLVPLVHVNVMWAVMEAAGLRIEWWSVLSFMLVVAWWEAPFSDSEWKQVYRVSAVLLEVFLLVFSYWLPVQTASSMVLTWATCALLVAILGIRHGWITLGPLVIVLLTCAAAWGLPVMWWPVAWLGLAISTVVFIERLARRDTGDTILALDISTALAVLLTGLAALLAKGLPFAGVGVPAGITISVLLGAGTLLIWIGRRRSLSTAEHAGLWLVASAWADLYFAWFTNSGAYGLWLSLFAAIALLTERLLITFYHKKPKKYYSIRDVVVRWPLADLVIGLSAITVIWTGITAMDIPVADPGIIVTTLAVVVGVWLVAGMLYRMPVLLYVALTLAPLPYALLLIQTLPPFRDVAMIGLAWQVLGAVILLIGHLLPRYRPPMLAPLFIAGYVLLGLGLTMTLGNEMLLVTSLALVILVCAATSMAVIAGAHPAWHTFTTWLTPPDERPYAFKHVRSLFIFLTAWLAVIWIHLMLGYADMSAPRQGIVLVLMSSVWIVMGRLLPRLPDVVGWPVYAAGWFMWLMGLLQVFFSPTEAIIAAILGLALSGEQLHRSREIHWMPVFILQVLYTALQVAWMLSVPGYGFLLAVIVSLAMVGMWYDYRGYAAGRITALTGCVLAAAMWLVHINPLSTLAMFFPAVMALLVYRRWELLLALLSLLTLLAGMFGLLNNWRLLMGAGIVQLCAASALVITIRPRRFYTFQDLMTHDRDWATPLLWFGTLSTAAGFWLGWSSTGASTGYITSVFVLAFITGLLSLILKTARLPYVSVGLLVAAGLMVTVCTTRLTYSRIGEPLAAAGIGLAVIGLLFRLFVMWAVASMRPFDGMRGLVWWLRPLHQAGMFLAVTSVVVVNMAQLYDPDPTWFIAGCALWAITSVLVFHKNGHPLWLMIAIGLCGLAWTRALSTLELTAAQWYTVPLGILLLVLVRLVDRIDPGLTEVSAITLLAYGAGVDILNTGMLSLAAVVFGAQLVGLVIYGCHLRRVIPLVSAGAIISGGLALKVFLINPWLIPLSTGLLLLALALLVETRRNWLERWLSHWTQ